VEQFGEDEQGEGIVLGGSRYPWEGTDRDYHYEEVPFLFSCSRKLFFSWVIVLFDHVLQCGKVS